MRTKLLAIVAVVWVAAVGAITVVYAVNKPTHFIRYGTYRPDGTYTGAVTKTSFDWGGYWAWAGGVTLVAAVAAAIIYIVTRPSTAS